MIRNWREPFRHAERLRSAHDPPGASQGRLFDESPMSRDGNWDVDTALGRQHSPES